ncbi:arginine--tRNA ligase, partial [Candidatus Peregrinibacteria bacterium]|nr:arginine--tRNA ligase [Candidatus Peregrinibacteria bacterium]
MDLCASLTGVLSAFLRQEWGLEETDIRWEFPSPEHGDSATPLAFHLAKELHQSPAAIAERLVREVQKCPGIERCAVAGAGYVNVWFTPAFLLQGLDGVHQACVPLPLHRDQAPVIIDYSQPNIAKPLGVHHLLSTIIGQALCNLYRHAGIPVVGWNYIGDWGTQFGKLAVAWMKWGGKRDIQTWTLDELLSLYVRFHTEAAADPVLEAAGREAFRKLESGDRDLRAFWRGVVAVTKSSLAGIYRRLHVRFDTDIGESFYEDKMAPVLEEGKRKGVFVAGEGGALIVEFPEESHLPPFLVQKGDGATLYATRDLAQIRYRTDTYHPQAILYVVDRAQELYFRQMFATVEKFGWEVPHLEHVVFGRMRFADAKMSTRAGTVLKLEHVLDEAVDRAGSVIDQHRDTIQTDDRHALAEMMGTGALVYGILSQNRTMDIIFDWEKFLSFDGNSAPYLQYTHARARSVLRKAGGEGARVTVSSLTPTERFLIVQLLQFPSVRQESRDDHVPHKLCQYLYQLCQAYNAFYTVDPILTAASSVRDMR